MVDHFGITCADLPAAARFYDEVLGAPGDDRVMDVGVAIGSGSAGQAAFWISAAAHATPTATTSKP